MDNERKPVAMQFAAIEKMIEQSIPKLIERKNGSNKWVSYGDDNAYPDYLFGLFNDVTTLKTIIEGIADYVLGDSLALNWSDGRINARGDDAEDVVRNCVRDYMIYGSFALNVIRNNRGDVSGLYWVDMRHIRTDEENEVFWYSKEWSKKWGRTGKAVVLPKFIPGARDVASSILFVKNGWYGTYAIPLYSGAIKACEIERKIDTMHLNGLTNGFMPSALISFNNGIPSDEQKAEIENSIYEKFVSEDNAGRILLAFSNGKDNATTIETIKGEDFGEKYKAASTRSRELIYSAFRATPNLFGLMTETAKGFNSQEFAEAFRLFNKTVIRPLQKILVNAFDRATETEGVLEIEPFSYDDVSE